MIQQFLNYLKTNSSKIKKYLIYGLLLFLLISLSVNSCQNKRFKEIKKSNREMKDERIKILARFDSLNAAFNDREKVISLLEFRSDSLKKAYLTLKVQMDIKEKEYLNQIADLTTIPPDTIHKNILVYNPNINNDLLRYPFGATQIRFFYKEHISLDYNKGLVIDLNKSLELCNIDNKTKSSIIVEKNGQLDILAEKIRLTDNLVSNLTDQNKSLEKSYKSERMWKKIWQYVSAGEAGVLIYKLIQK